MATRLIGKNGKKNSSRKFQRQAMSGVIILPKQHLIQGGGVPIELYHSISQAEYNSICMAAQLCDSESKKLALLFEVGACVIFCLFCAFCCHACIADALFDTSMQP